MAKTYYLVLYEQGKAKGCAAAMPSFLDEETAKVMLQDANPTVERKREGKKFQVVDKRLFEFKNLDGSTTLMIVCDVTLIKP